MRAVAFEEFGGPEVLRVCELPDPVPGSSQARVRVHAASVNPTDTIFRSGMGYARDVAHPRPWVPGMDFAGVVESTGPNSRWTVGQNVLGVAMPAGTRQGAYADLVVVPDDALAPLPFGLTFAEASTLPMNGLTALRTLDWLGEHDVASIGVTGAAGAVGTMVIELAKQRALQVVADAQDSDVMHVRATGADLVLRRGPGWPARVTAHRQYVDALVDAGVYGPAALGCVRPGGLAALLRPEPAATTEHQATPDVTTQVIAMTDYYRRHDKLLEITAAAEARVLSTRVAAVLRPAEAAAAHARLEAGGVRGRLVLDFS